MSDRQRLIHDLREYAHFTHEEHGNFEVGVTDEERAISRWLRSGAITLSALALEAADMLEADNAVR